MNAEPASFRISFSIGQSMVVVLIIGLCLAPLMSAARMLRGELILAAVFFDVVALPILASVVLAAMLKPGPWRDWCYKALWLTPVLFVGSLLMASVPAIFLSVLWTS